MTTNKNYVDRLSRIECQDSTYRSADPALVFAKAKASTIVDVEGQSYVDLCAGFGTLAFGHNSQIQIDVFKELNEDMPPIVHGMGDVYASKDKVELFEELKSVLPKHLEKGALAISGGQAVELAIKTALLSGKSSLISFKGSYHGLDLGILPVTSRSDFKQPFNSWISERHRELPFLCTQKELTETIEDLDKDVAAIIVEPVQGRAGGRLSEDSWLKMLRDVCDKYDIDLIFDEDFTGMGRIGSFTKAFDVKADMVCFGKALGGGLPLSAMFATSKVMDRWPLSKGEAIHPGTFFGHPLSCRLGVQVIRKLKKENWLDKVQAKGNKIAEDLRGLESTKIKEIRQYGLMIVLEFKEDLKGARMMDDLRSKGVVALASGERGESLSITPAFNLPDKDWEFALDQIKTLI